MVTSPPDHWRDQLEQRAIPEAILRAAPENPHTFSVDHFAARAAEALREPLTPSHLRAREQVPDGGAVLDVGCGGGAASLPLVPPARRLIGVDTSAGMLAAFADAAAARGAEVATWQGRWPDVAADVPVADVVVCAHVVYNVADLVPFIEALTDHATRRVVLEFPTRHPLAWLTPYWKAVHDLDLPDGPTSDDALAVIRTTGVEPLQERWRRPVSLHRESVDTQAGFIRTQLALGPERADEVRALVDRYGVPAERDIVTVWWDV